MAPVTALSTSTIAALGRVVERSGRRTGVRPCYTAAVVHLPLALSAQPASPVPASVRRGDVPEATWLDWRWLQADDDREGSAEAEG